MRSLLRSRPTWGLALSLTLLLSLVISSLPIPHAQAADAYDTLRDKQFTLMTGGNGYTVTNGTATDPDINNRIQTINTKAQNTWNSLQKGSARTSCNCLWTDLTSTTDSAHITSSYNRIKDMAMAYATRGAPLNNNTSLLTDLKDALDWMYSNRYNENKTAYSNWYDWEIGSPLTLNDITVLLYNQLSSTQITNYMNAINKFTPNVTLTGANRVWKAQVVAIRGIIVKDSAKITNARDNLSPVFDYVTSGDGFYSDGSFIQHSRHPYNGGYGAAMVGSLPALIYLLNGSSWAVTDTDQSNVYRWIYDGFEPLMFRGAMMDMSRGRDVSRYSVQDHARGNSITSGALRVSQYAPTADANRLKSMVKEWLISDTYYPYLANASVYNIIQSKAILNDSSITARGDLVRHKRYPNMDRVAHSRPGWAYAISMSSNRIFNYEAINTEHKRAWYTADGMTYLYNADLAQYSDDFWPTVNAYRLPGTTIDTITRATADNTNHQYLSPNNWVGGVTTKDNLYGISGMDLNAYGNDLVAKKSWFMFDDEVVALGAGITDTTQSGNGWDGNPRRVETIVENRKITTAGTNPLEVNGTLKPTSLGWSETMTGVNWMHLQGNGTGDGPDIGYYFPGGATVKAKREARTATWNDINGNAAFVNPTSITRNYLTMWFDHGTNPSNKTYSYVLLPGKNTSAVSAYATTPEIQIWHNSSTIQAVKESTLNIVGANFWSDGSQTVYINGDTARPFITSDKKSSIIVNESVSGQLEIDVSDPTQANTGTINVEVRKSASQVLSLSDPAITVIQTSPTIKLSINVNGSKGKTFSTVLDV